MLGEERAKLVTQLEKHLGGNPHGVRLRELPAKRLNLVVDPCEIRIDDKIALSPADLRKLPDQRAAIDLKIEAGAVQILSPGE